MNEQLNEVERKECAKTRLDISLSYQQAAERRGSELADEFTRLEVQIATILFAFSGFFFNFFDGGEKPFSSIVLFLLKFMFASSLFFLISSLAVGLLHLKSKEKFWGDMSKQRITRLQKWLEAVERKTSFEEASAFHEGTGLQKGLSISSPIWSWVIQTICLGLAIILLFTLFLIFLFH